MFLCYTVFVWYLYRPKESFRHSRSFNLAQQIKSLWSPRHCKRLFLSSVFNRTQTTEINSFISDKEIVPCGVPQGSVLGPLLFLIFINDIPNSSQKLDFVLFADDTNILYADRHPKSLEETVNKDLKNVCEWLHVNKLTLNIKKSHFVIFRPPQRSLNYEINLKATAPTYCQV